MGRYIVQEIEAKVPKDLEENIIKRIKHKRSRLNLEDQKHGEKKLMWMISILCCGLRLKTKILRRIEVLITRKNHQYLLLKLLKMRLCLSELSPKCFQPSLVKK